LTDTSHAALELLLTRLEGAPCAIELAEPLAHDRGPSELKRIGYGVPILVRYRVTEPGREREARAVFRTQTPNWFGHDRRSDRACLSLLAADTYDAQPKHIAVKDVGAIRGDELLSLRDAGEFYLVTTYVEGRLYAEDLRRVAETGHASATDLARARALARHLTELHTPIDGGRDVYVRAVRDLVGSGEGIFGIVDSYPADFEREDLLRAIEHRAIDWRARLVAQHAATLCRTHGDFHPYNVLFREGVDFTLLDASRGGAGDAADDVAAMLINYLFQGHADARRLGRRLRRVVPHLRGRIRRRRRVRPARALLRLARARPREPRVVPRRRAGDPPHAAGVRAHLARRGPLRSLQHRREHARERAPARWALAPAPRGADPLRVGCVGSGMRTSGLLALFIVPLGCSTSTSPGAFLQDRPHGAPVTSPADGTDPRGGGVRAGGRGTLVVSTEQAEEYLRVHGLDVGEGVFRPEDDEVEGMLRALEGGLSERGRSTEEYYYQVVGRVRSGRHELVVFGACSSVGSDWRTPNPVDDGGNCFFEATYDVAGRTLTSVRFNGQA
jgi:hypothetical protein